MHLRMIFWLACAAVLAACGGDEQPAEAPGNDVEPAPVDAIPTEPMAERPKAPDPTAGMEANYANTLQVFRDAGLGDFFDYARGYAIFPTVGKGGLGIGGAFGKGQVYEWGEHIGNTSMSKVSIGLQAGGQAFSQVIFFEDQRPLDEFTGGNFEFGAEASAVALTAGASAAANTTGASAGASGTQHRASTSGNYRKGMATFTVVKGGLMYEASVTGQKFGYTPLAEE